jgi:hypothetical protein
LGLAAQSAHDGFVLSFSDDCSHFFNWLFQVHLLSSALVFTTRTMSTAKCFSLLLEANSSSLVRRPVPAMRKLIPSRFVECTSDRNFIDSWVAGALDSAWRAVDQYLALNLPDYQQKFWDLWGPTEYWDEGDNQDLIALNRKLMERHLVIGLHKDGVTTE